MSNTATEADKTICRLLNLILQWRDVSNWHQEPYRTDVFAVFQEACESEGNVTVIHRDRIWGELADRLMVDNGINIREPTTDDDDSLSKRIFSVLSAWEEWSYALKQVGWNVVAK